MPIERNGDLLHDPTVFHSSAQAGNIGHIGNAQACAGHSTVNIRLDGIGQHQVGLAFPDPCPVLPHQRHLLQGIGSVAFHGLLDKAAAQGLQILPMPVLMGKKYHLAAFNQGLDQLPAKAVQPGTAVIDN